ncbi:hypothetical protein PMQ09_07790, partial [Bifidobacterium longum]|uniref:hypothetical protein n=1 Tax=Bifidobacterium longum TaxID=216816 RepID=UPI001E4E133D
FVSVASGHLTLLAVGQVLQRSLEPALSPQATEGSRFREKLRPHSNIKPATNPQQRILAQGRQYAGR